MITELVSATDLERWADLRNAQAQLPRLVRRLIASTASGLTALSMRAGEGVQMPGWDGIVVAENSDAHVPAGTSVWEMGVNADPTDKANEDYRKRKVDPGDAIPTETTFVFVTPRRWHGKDAWVKRKRKIGDWKNVIAYDADDLETWLERTPEVHAWVSALLGKDPSEAESLETWWESWSNATRPPLSAALLLSGRDEAVTQVLNALRAQDESLSLTSDSQEEVVAFLAAVLQREAIPELQLLLRRALLVRTQRAWRRIAVSERPLILLPLFDRPDVALATSHGHTVLVPLGREVASTSGIELPRLQRGGIEAALVEIGLPRERASVLATLGRRSLLSLRRSFAINPDVLAPLWARPEHTRDIIPAILAGTWHENKAGDQYVLAALAGRTYDEVAQVLTRWANVSDPPVRHVGNMWIVAARLDAWMLVARSITLHDLQRFREVALQVIGGEDPALDLEPRLRMMASLLGKERPHSGHLIGGLADTLALMASTSDQVSFADDRRGQDEADVVVRMLLEAANADSSGRRWVSLSIVLPSLAEAAPDVFLRAVEAGLNGDEPVVLKLFQDGKDFDFLFGSSPHTGLLWALENVAWSPDYLGRAALLLAKLVRLEPGGRLANRPNRSLEEILLLWRPGTSATMMQRLKIIDLLRKREPEVAWPLMLRLIPSGHGVSSLPHAPKWRDWKPERTNGTTYAELNQAIAGIASRALKDVGTNGYRWTQLLDAIANLPPSVRNEIIGTLQQIQPTAIENQGRAKLADALRNIVGRHRQFSEADWAMPLADVERLADLIPRFELEDPIANYSWLFRQGALFAFEDQVRGERHTKLITAQKDAVQKVYEIYGPSGILKWSEQLDENFGTSQLGRILANISVNDEDMGVFYDALVSEVYGHRQIAYAYTYNLALTQGEAWFVWAENTFSEYNQDWPPEHRAAFLSALPATQQVWDLAEDLGVETDSAYWQYIRLYNLSEGGDACIQVARKLLQYDRPQVAIYLLNRYADGIPTGAPNSLVADALEQLVQTPGVNFDSALVDDIGDHLGRLEKGQFDEQRLAALEWTYLPLFRYQKRHSGVLHRALSTDPAFFVQIVSLAYRARGAPVSELSADEEAQAHTAHALLDAWRLVPGKQEDGSIEGAALRNWVAQARVLLANSGRIEIGDECIGRVLRYGPPPQEDEWPTESIRDLIEELGSDNTEDGLQSEVYNSRGVTWRESIEGGQQERELASNYRRYAAFALMTWPRTAAMLTRMAKSYEGDARHHDTDADLTQDFWQ